MLPGFSTQHIMEGAKIADKMLKQLNRDDPRSATIALGMCLVVAAKASNVKLPHIRSLLETIQENLEKSPVAIAAQDAIAALIMPGGALS